MDLNIDKNELLINVKEILQNEVPGFTYEMWFKDLEYKSFNDTTIIFNVKTPFNQEILQNKYLDLIQAAFLYITHKKYNILFECEEKENIGNSFEDSYKVNIQSINNTLNPKYTFDSFVVGNNNRLAHAAALGITEDPGGHYNPFFLYGGSGLGKTHLMHAIGNKIQASYPNYKVIYITSEKFTNEFINSIKDNKNEDFRNKYRNVDVLLIDDIQFIAGKDSVQEEFFHTFNTLKENGKQIILSSDKAPKDIDLLEERLKTRFAWGLISDISVPDYETRFAILRKKADLEHIEISNDILSSIAIKIDTNIRELEGALNKIVAEASLYNIPISEELAEEALLNIVNKKEKVISIEYIQEVVSKYFGIDIRDLKSSKKSNDIVFPRQVAMYLCRTVANASFPKIGEDFGKRDHTTVMHACNKIENEIKNNIDTKSIVENVKKTLKE